MTNRDELRDTVLVLVRQNRDGIGTIVGVAQFGVVFQRHDGPPVLPVDAVGHVALSSVAAARRHNVSGCRASAEGDESGIKHA